MTVNGTELGAQEWRDSFFLGNGIDPPDLPSHCDGCGAAFTIYHALYCKKGGLIMARHNKIHDGVRNLAGKAFTTGTTVPDNAPPLEATQYKGDLLVRDLWKNGTDSVHNMCVVNIDAKYH